MSVMDKIKSVRADFLADFKSVADSLESVNQIRAKYIGRKGIVTGLLKLIPDIEPKNRGVFGKALNNLKIEIATSINSKELTLKDNKIFSPENIDLTLPEKIPRIGANHILEKTLIEIKSSTEDKSGTLGEINKKASQAIQKSRLFALVNKKEENDV